MTRFTFITLFFWLCSPFSRLINRISWRFGRPYRCTIIQVDPVRMILQPGMVILTHKKYEFSTMFIPGYWTHSALVASREIIIEATSKGVRANPLEKFITTVDDFIVLKPRFCCQDTMKRAGEHASGLVGYPYCFDFRNSDRMFYCSGLICWVYLRTLTEKHSKPKMPFVLQHYINGKIILPEDLYSLHDAWQVIGNPIERYQINESESYHINC